MAFYEFVGTDEETGATVYAATPETKGPWGPPQHGGPASALIAHTLARVEPEEGTRIASVTVNLLGSVPVGEVRVAASMVRPGRRIKMLAATLEARDDNGNWRVAAQATAWRLRTQDTSDVARLANPVPNLPGPEAAVAYDMPDIWPRDGFLAATDWRFVAEGGDPGSPTIAWIRIPGQLVAGEDTTGLERALMVADTTNGVGGRLDPYRYTYLNTETSVHLHHPPEGEWFGVAADTSIGPDGIGTATSILLSESGPIGRVTQTLLAEPR